MEVKQSGKTGTFVVIAIIFAITVLSNFSKELFVEQSGKFEIFGNLGFILVIGLLWRWKHIGKVVSILTSLAILAIMMNMLMMKSISVPFLIILVGLSISFYLTTFSTAVNIYLNKIEE